MNNITPSYEAYPDDPEKGDLFEDVDRIYHRDVTRIQMALVEGITRIKAMSCTFTITSNGMEQELVSTQMERTLREDAETSIHILNNIRARRKHNILLYLNGK